MSNLPADGVNMSKAILVPSGDQLGPNTKWSSSMSTSILVTEEPSAATAQMNPLYEVRIVKPSGDQLAVQHHRSAMKGPICCRFEPSASTVMSAKLRWRRP